MPQKSKPNLDFARFAESGEVLEDAGRSQSGGNEKKCDIDHTGPSTSATIPRHGVGDKYYDEPAGLQSNHITHTRAAFQVSLVVSGPTLDCEDTPHSLGYRVQLVSHQKLLG